MDANYNDVYIYISLYLLLTRIEYIPFWIVCTYCSFIVGYYYLDVFSYRMYSHRMMRNHTT